MEIVIKIPKQMYLNAKAGMLCGSDSLVNAIKNGTPLPKGHGRLIDADKIKFEYLPGSNEWIATEAQIDNQTTIIEANKEGVEE